MDCMQVTQHNCGPDKGHCQLKLINFETQENDISHETQGLSTTHLVVRRGKPFKVTLFFDNWSWHADTENLVLEVRLGDMSKRFSVQFSDESSNPNCWSAKTYPGDVHLQSVSVHICSPVLSSVGLYHLLLHVQTRQNISSFTAGCFVLLCNPWLEDDPVYMSLDVGIEEYIKSDYGLVYMGTHQSMSCRPWSFGQYEPGVLEACLQLLQVSPQHLSDKNKDYTSRADPVYISSVICAMVNCNDDLGILMGKWQGSYKDGVRPTDWTGSADILQRWVSSKCSPVRYGQCWVFATVLCTVMRVLGIPSRVVTVFNAAHDGDSSLTITEYYSSTGEKLHLSKDSVWNFHVWVECWMRRPDLGAGFDGWQVVDPTPQEKSAGIYCCGPCPVAAIHQQCLGTPYDCSFIYASVDANIVRLIVRNGLVVRRTVDTESVGQLIYTKSIGSDKPANLTQTYKRQQPAVHIRTTNKKTCCYQSAKVGGAVMSQESAGSETSPGLEVSLHIDGAPYVGSSIDICVTVTNQSSSPRVLMEHLNAQLKVYNSSPQESFWKTHSKVHIQAGGVMQRYHTISLSEYESFLAEDDIVSLAVVIKDKSSKERVLAVQEFSMSSPQITIELEGGDSVQMKREHTAHVSFINTFTKTLTGAVLTVEGFGLLQGKHEARLVLLQPGDKIEKEVSIVATSPGTKLLLATFSHSSSSEIISRRFYKVSVMTN